jgi:hypothetical protein
MPHDDADRMGQHVKATQEHILPTDAQRAPRQFQVISLLPGQRQRA